MPKVHKTPSEPQPQMVATPKDRKPQPNLEQLKKELSTAKGELTKIKKTNAELQDKIKAAEAAEAKAEDARKSAEAKAKEAEKAKNEAEKARKEVEAKLTAAEKASKELQGKLTAAEKVNVELKDKLNDTLRVNLELKDKFVAAEAKIKALEAQPHQPAAQAVQTKASVPTAQVGAKPDATVNLQTLLALQGNDKKREDILANAATAKKLIEELREAKANAVAFLQFVDGI